MIRTDTTDLIQFLNDLVAIDAKAVTDLVNSRVQCSEALADHPSVQVGGEAGKPETFRVGMLGLLNGYCGTIDQGEKAGWGPITAEFDGDTITRFVRTEG